MLVQRGKIRMTDRNRIRILLKEWKSSNLDRFFFIFAAYAYSGTYSYPKRSPRVTLSSSTPYLPSARAEKFRSRIFLRMGGVTLTAKDRASTRPFFPFLKWNCTITFRFTLSTPLCDAYLSRHTLFDRILCHFNNKTQFSRNALYMMNQNCLSFRF